MPWNYYKIWPRYFVHMFMFYYFVHAMSKHGSWYFCYRCYQCATLWMSDLSDRQNMLMSKFIVFLIILLSFASCRLSASKTGITWWKKPQRLKSVESYIYYVYAKVSSIFVLFYRSNWFSVHSISCLQKEKQFIGN